jgi:hypothetical protein
MVRLWAWSLRTRAGGLASSPLTVTFNDRADTATAEWLRQFPATECVVRPRLSAAHREVNKYNALWAPGLDSADWVILTDCDVAFVSDLSPLADALGDADFAAAPEGHEPRNPPPGRPRHYKTIRHYEALLLRETGLTREALAAHRHPWFTDRWPCTTYPYFNGGFIAIRGTRLAEFREAILGMSSRLFRRARINHPNPLFFLQRFWNSRWDRTPWADRLCIGPFFRQRYADQVALAVVAIKKGFRYRVLPHCFNWRSLGMGHGEELPIRVLHYFEPALGLPADRILDTDWIADYSASTHPGRQALAGLVRDFLATTGQARPS